MRAPEGTCKSTELVHEAEHGKIRDTWEGRTVGNDSGLWEKSGPPVMTLYSLQMATEASTVREKPVKWLVCRYKVLVAEGCRLVLPFTQNLAAMG